jgi:hypothetical protein
MEKWYGEGCQAPGVATPAVVSIHCLHAHPVTDQNCAHKEPMMHAEQAGQGEAVAPGLAVLRVQVALERVLVAVLPKQEQEQEQEAKAQDVDQARCLAELLPPNRLRLPVHVMLNAGAMLSAEERKVATLLAAAAVGVGAAVNPYCAAPPQSH